jgi:hypothetical protein
MADGLRLVENQGSVRADLRISVSGYVEGKALTDQSQDFFFDRKTHAAACASFASSVVRQGKERF